MRPQIFDLEKILVNSYNTNEYLRTGRWLKLYHNLLIFNLSCVWKTMEVTERVREITQVRSSLASQSWEIRVRVESRDGSFGISAPPVIREAWRPPSATTPSSSPSTAVAPVASVIVASVFAIASSVGSSPEVAAPRTSLSLGALGRRWAKVNIQLVLLGHPTRIAFVHLSSWFLCKTAGLKPVKTVQE